MERTYSRRAERIKEKTMINISARELKKETMFTVYEGNNKLGFLKAKKMGTNLFIEEISIGKNKDFNYLNVSKAKILEFLIKSCVNYSINRNILSVILNCQYDQEILLSIGFEKSVNGLAYYVPSNLNNGCCNSI